MGYAGESALLTDVEESWVTTDDGVRLWSVRSGSGTRPVVCCHGGPGGWDLMDPVAEMLDDLASVMRWDQRGCGRSEGDGPYSFERFAADLDAVRRHWGIDTFTLAGHSSGASLALLYALTNPEQVRAVIYLSGTGLHWVERDSDIYHANREQRLGAYFERWRELREKKSPTPAERRELTLLSISTDFGDTAASLELAQAWFDDRYEPNLECNAHLGAAVNERTAWAREHLSSVAWPVLVVHGDRDPRPSRGAIELAGALPDARLVLLERVGHLPWAQEPDQLRRALREFLRQ